MEPLLSVIVPVYKVESYIRQCLDSLVNQTLTDLEIIVIDDGSPDNCGVICDEYAKKYANMRVIHKQNAGLREARNQGIDEAKGEWITFVDSDDWCDVDYYEKLFQAMGDRKTMDVFCAGGRVIELPRKSVIAYTFPEAADYQKREELDILMARTLSNRWPYHGKMILRPLDAPWDKIYRADFLRKHGLRYDADRQAWEDTYFNYQVYSLAERIGAAPVIGYHYRYVANSITHQYNPKRPEINYGFLEDVRRYAPEKLEPEFMRQAFYSRAFVMMSNTLRLCYLNESNPDPEREIKRSIYNMTRRPYFQEALGNISNSVLTKEHLLLKYLLKQPFLWPLKLVYRARGN